jgi:hypothetical protein
MDSGKPDFSPECVEKTRVRFWCFEHKLAIFGLGPTITNLQPFKTATIEGEGRLGY